MPISQARLGIEVHGRIQIDCHFDPPLDDRTHISWTFITGALPTKVYSIDGVFPRPAESCEDALDRSQFASDKQWEEAEERRLKGEQR